MQSLDQPLDAIIQSKRKQRQPRRQRGSKPQTSKQSAGVQQPQVAPQVTTAQAVASQAHVGDKIIVSNLPDDVNEQQIKVSLSLYSSSQMCSGSQPIHTSIGVVPHYCRDCTQCQLVLQRSRQIERNRYYSIPQSRICHRRLSTIQQTFDRWKWVTNSSLSTTSFYDPSDSPPLSPPNEFDSPPRRRLVAPLLNLEKVQFGNRTVSPESIESSFHIS